MNRKEKMAGVCLIGLFVGATSLGFKEMQDVKTQENETVRVSAIDYTGPNVCVITATGKDAYGKTQLRATNNTGFSPDCPRVGDILYRCDYSNELSPQKSQCTGSKMAVYAIIGERERP
jgi:hypothetical protein